MRIFSTVFVFFSLSFAFSFLVNKHVEAASKSSLSTLRYVIDKIGQMEGVDNQAVVAQLIQLVEKQQKSKRFEKCMSLFRSHQICQQENYSFYIWTRKIAAQIMKGQL